MFGLLLAVGAMLAAVGTISQLPKPEQSDYDPSMPLLLLVGSGALAFFALVALGPLLVRPVLAVVGWPLRQLGPLGRMAVGGIGGAPRRAAAVSVVVALGVTLISGVVIGGASLQILADREMALSAPTDFEVTSNGGTLPPAVVTRAEAARGALARVVPYRMVGDATLLRGADKLGDVESGYPTSDLDLAALPNTGDLDVAQGALTDRGPGRIVLNGWVARDAVCGPATLSRSPPPPAGSTCGWPRSCPVTGPLHGGHPRRSGPTWTGSVCRPRTPVCWPTRPAPARTVAPPACGRCGRRSVAATGWASRCSPTNGTATTRWCARWSGSLSVWSA